MRIHPFAVLLPGLICAACLSLFAGDVTGRVQVIGRTKHQPAATVVSARPLDDTAPPRPQFFTMAQQNKAFVPRILAIPAGSTVDFPNNDLIFHNVFSLSQPNPFDLGLYRAGASRSHLFADPGTYRVFCNIHPEMTAVILVLPASFINQANAGGHYRLELPPGRYRITAWSERSQPATAEITVSADPATVPDLSLDESRFVELPHKNKFGQDYPNSVYDPLKDQKTRQ